eukprot:5066817-Amphidinium_carterae.1
MRTLPDIWIRPCGPLQGFDLEIRPRVRIEEWLDRDNRHTTRKAWHQSDTSARKDARICYGRHHAVLRDIAGRTTYEAALGKAPPMLPCSFEDSTVEALREIALSAMVQNIVQDRVRRAEQAQSQQAVQQLHVYVGDLVDLIVHPSQKRRQARE